MINITSLRYVQADLLNVGCQSVVNTCYPKADLSKGSVQGYQHLRWSQGIINEHPPRSMPKYSGDLLRCECLMQ